MTAIDTTYSPRLDSLNDLNEKIDESKSIPLFPKATSLLFNSGNVVSSDRLKKRTNLNPQEEVNEVLNNTIASWLNSIDKTSVQENVSVVCRHPEFYERLEPSEVDDMSISVKLFLNSFDVDVLNKSIKTIFDEIGTNRIDTLILSFPDKIFNHEELPKEVVLPLWLSIQKYVDSKQVCTAGLSDFTANYLQQLWDALEDKNQKPSLNQVNLTACCKMPEDLVEFAKINNIQLTTHIDPKEILTVESLQSNIKKNCHEYDSHGWIHLWIARYTLILKGRGIVKSKGYIVSTQRELRYTK